MRSLEQLQETALQLELDIVDADGNELDAGVLSKAIAAKEAANKAEAKVAKAAAKTARKTAKEIDDAEDAVKKAAREAASAAVTVREADPKLLTALGLSKPTGADLALAKEHAYPVAIPGAKPYEIRVSMQCAFGGGLRPAGSVMLLTDAHAAKKREYLTPA